MLFYHNWSQPLRDSLAAEPWESRRVSVIFQGDAGSLPCPSSSLLYRMLDSLSRFSRTYRTINNVQIKLFKQKCRVTRDYDQLTYFQTFLLFPNRIHKLLKRV
jgi:hypothetical protein